MWLEKQKKKTTVISKEIKKTINRKLFNLNKPERL